MQYMYKSVYCIITNDIFHSFNRQQNVLKKSIITNNQTSWLATEDDCQTLRGLRYVGGIDLSYWKSNPTYACACLVIFKFPEMEVSSCIERCKINIQAYAFNVIYLHAAT